jgi:flagellar biosynthesis/type III secretory pathway protein FliH
VDSSPDPAAVEKASEANPFLTAGSSAIGEILATTERALDQIAEQTNREADQVYAGTEQQAVKLAQERIRAITTLRAELMERASELAMRFEQLLDLLRERQRITYSTDSPQEPRRIVRPRPQAPVAEPRRSRWWQRWFRDAA